MRQGAEEIDLRLELLGVEALDTGRHRALVVIDPKDQRNLQGFLYLSNRMDSVFCRTNRSWNRSSPE